ncbi:hypothetical protein B0T16DRAFT_460447 [Cercophora newfieldiana]|uniref:Uncharacterized protein n=1 Tax=Cercophora newfieldiana TaxID=92897 RepID=A0AA39Y4J8_9PEZI|nr:hypothetical protein B0T16DRAFT_460447 [Cercophora newfieldiana]
MHLSTLTLTLPATASHVVADRLDVLHTWLDPYWGGANRDTYAAIWHNNFGNHYNVLDASDGYHSDPGIPSVTKLCLDHANHRAHFEAVGQPKRCFERTKVKKHGTCPLTSNCYADFEIWPELTCYW